MRGCEARRSATLRGAGGRRGCAAAMIGRTDAKRRRGEGRRSATLRGVGGRQGCGGMAWCPGLFALALDRASAHPCLAHPSGVSRTLPHHIKHTEVERVQVDPLPIL